MFNNRRLVLVAVLLACVLFQAVAPPAAARSLGIRGSTETVDSGPRFPWSFAYVHDTHWRWNFGGGLFDGIRNDHFHRAVIDTLNELAAGGNCDFLLFGGDWAHDVFIANNHANRDSFRVQMGRLRIPVFPTVGNHEFDEGDTLAGRPPHYRASQMTMNFATHFGMKTWYRATWKNVEIYALNVNPNLPGLDSFSDYRTNNPTHYSSPYGGTVNDFYGIGTSSSVQRDDLTTWYGMHDPAAWEFFLFHRSIAGCDEVDERQNYKGALRGSGFIREWEADRPVTDASVIWSGDQHIVRVARLGRDSTIAVAGEGGTYHVLTCSGAGIRQADMEDLFGATDSHVLMQIARDADDAAVNAGRTSVGVMDTLTFVGDPELPYQYYWCLATVYGDEIELKTFRTLSSRSESANWYTGDGSHVLVDRRTLRRDHRPY